MTAASPPGGTTRLFWLPSIVLLAGMAALALALRRPVAPAEALMAAALAAMSAIAPWLVLRKSLPWDPVLGGCVWLLCFLGALSVYRVTPHLFAAQLSWVLLGSLGLFAVLLLPDLLRHLRRYKYSLLLAGVMLTALSLAWGSDLSGTGARLWLQVGPLLFQPSEVLRVLLVVFLAAYLDEKREMLTSFWLSWRGLRIPPLPYLIPLLAMVALALVILIYLRDLGPVLLYAGTFLAMFYMAAGRRDYVLAGMALFAGAAFIGYSASEHIQTRFALWLDPWSDPLGGGYQSLQALGGLAFGGLAGRGPGYGYPDVIPAAHTDFALVAFAEEWGLIGTVIVLLLYALLVSRGLGLAARMGQDRFAQLLVAGLSASFGIQAFIILGGGLRLIPLSGITAPFLSYGGSSMVMGLFAAGLMLRAWGETREEAWATA